MIIKLLVLAVLGWFAVKVWQAWQKQQALQRQNERPPERFEPMARCAQCGVHLPVSALSRNGRCGRCGDGSSH